MLSKLSFWHTFKVYCTHKYNKHLKKEREPPFLCTHRLLVVLLLIQALNGLFSCISADTVWMEQSDIYLTHSQFVFILSPSFPTLFLPPFLFSSFCLPPVPQVKFWFGLSLERLCAGLAVLPLTCSWAICVLKQKESVDGGYSNLQSVFTTRHGLQCSRLDWKISYLMVLC